MADRNSAAMSRLLHQYGIDYRIDPTVKFSSVRKSGRPDYMFPIFGIHSADAYFLECKAGNGSFDYAGWTPQQQAWADTFCNMGKHPILRKDTLWFALTLYGVNKKDIPATWIIPYHTWLDVYTETITHQNSLPRCVYPNTLNVMKEKKLCAEDRFDGYALRREKVGKVWEWILPTDHPFFYKVIAYNTKDQWHITEEGIPV